MRPDTLDRQVDGTHYKDMKIQPWTIIQENNLDFWHGSVLKYLLRWQDKDGIIDLDKIIHYVEHIKALALGGHYGSKFTPKIAPSHYRSLEEDIDADLRRLSLETSDVVLEGLVKRFTKPKVKRSAKKHSKSKLK